MKFYNGGKSYSGFYRNKIVKFKLNAIYCGYYYTRFFENGIRGNSKNASYIDKYGNNHFCLNGIYYGNEKNFTKESWRRFIKMKVFL